MDSHDTISTKGRCFHCNLCNVKIVSERAVEDHLQGRKHQRLSAIQTSRQKQAKCSVFVGGLTKLVSDLELTDYFSKFGSVAQVIVDKDKGKFAIVEFAEDGSAERAAEEEKQRMNGKRITVRPREHKPFSPRGKQQHVSAGKQAKTARDRETDAVLDRLVEEENVCSQIETLVDETCLDQSDLQLRFLICDLIQEVFVEVFPKCRVFPYGSSVSGFGVKGCDLDLQVDLGRDAEPFAYRFASMPLLQADDGEEAESMETSAENDASAKTEGAGPSEASENKSSEEILGVLCRLLKQFVPSCQHVRVIPSSRRPVVKFIHRESGLHCDLSLDNRLALRNTELLHFYSCLDRRVRPLVFAVRLWARQHQLAGNLGGPGPRLTNYAVTLLVIHYLQNAQPQVLPTVSQLRQMAGAHENVTIENWDCTFTTDDTKVCCHDNTEDVESLMKGFFSFYTKCDLGTSVLCPVTGSTVPLTQFLQDQQQKAPQDPQQPSLEGSPPREFKVGPINVQDPLELTHNVAGNVNDKVSGKLRAELRKAELTCISLRYRKQQRVSPEAGAAVPRWGLLSLLEDGDAAGKGQKEGANQSPRIVIPLKVSQVTQEFVTRFQDAQEMKAAWCQHVEDFALRLISHTLGMECSDDRGTPEHGVGESGMHASPPKQETAPGNGALSDAMSKEEDSGGDVATGDSGIIKDDSFQDDAGEEETEEPTSKRQRLDSSLDDQHSVSMASSGDTSLTSMDDLGSCTPATGEESPVEHARAVICKTSHAVWVGRRKLRRKLQMENAGGDVVPIDEITKEKRITDELIRSTPSASSGSVTEFRLEIGRKLEADLTAVVLRFSAISNEVNVRNFAHFFEEFIARMLNHTKV